jgi:hypothetical protein
MLRKLDSSSKAPSALRSLRKLVSISSRCKEGGSAGRNTSECQDFLRKPQASSSSNSSRPPLRRLQRTLEQTTFLSDTS